MMHESQTRRPFDETYMKISSFIGGTLFASTLALIACSSGSPEDTQAEVSTEELSGVTALTAVSSGKCVEVAGSSTSNGAKIQQAACGTASNQRFQLKDMGGGQYELIGAGSGKCLDVASVSRSNGASMQQWDCGGGANQLWKLVSKGTSTYQVQSVNSGKCLDVTGNSTESGAFLQQWSCGSGSNQLFKISTSSGGGGAGGSSGSGSGSAGSSSAGSSSAGSSSTGVWNKANLTNFESYPDPGSAECLEFNGCTWAGQFAGIDGKQTESWVKAHNIVAVHSKDFGKYSLKTLRLKQGSKQIDVTVYDECADSDCSGCCTQNAKQNGLNFLIDIEKYSMQRFGSGDGIVEWQCLDCK